METTLDRLIEQWDGRAVVTRFHRPTGTWIFIALHDDKLGAPCGGTRLKSYPAPVDGLRDAMRLARGMTHKWAAIGLDSGGGKAVLAVPENLDEEGRRTLLVDYAGLLNSLRGAFSTGRDLGTTDADIERIARVTTHVHGYDRETGAVRDPGPYTARGVAAAIRATLRAALGGGDEGGRTILIQGVGDVGEPLARALAANGASLRFADVDAGKARALAEELGASVVSPGDVYDTECDLYAPCALGATLDADTIPRLRCRAVAGSANNQLGEEEDAERLHERGILYAPDFVANGGGALAFGLIHRGITDEDVLGARLDGIGNTLDEIYSAAGERNESPHRTVLRTIAERLRGARP